MHRKFYHRQFSIEGPIDSPQKRVDASLVWTKRRKRTAYYAPQHPPGQVILNRVVKSLQSSRIVRLHRNRNFQ
jgi:hypothetical protein